ncbi:MAG: ThiF family adenylyltransferase, partial [Carbonactinosporaceae bacterium]
ARREEGARRAMALAGAAAAAQRAVSGEMPQLAVLAPVGPLDGRLRDRLLRNGVAHLYAGVRELTGLVGPLVVPGRSSCLRCHDLHRTDRDPRWPRVAAQLATGTGSGSACDTVLGVTVAAHAALQALAYVDGGRPSAVDGTVEIGLPDGRVRRRSWTPHPGCGCGWAQSA